jgi:hypothetical protein
MWAPSEECRRENPVPSKPTSVSHEALGEPMHKLGNLFKCWRVRTIARTGQLLKKCGGRNSGQGGRQRSPGINKTVLCPVVRLTRFGPQCSHHNRDRVYLCRNLRRRCVGGIGDKTRICRAPLKTFLLPYHCYRHTESPEEARTGVASLGLRGQLSSMGATAEDRSPALAAGKRPTADILN